ncbi:hypothetical protein AB0M86_24960 [Streptomyces sp. NPDC051639]|uniref:hypothetical protein n=1 Tax=Streptomyces sp. NPDC051639 TaxID=3155671 RepID=UPI00341F0940
MMKARTYPLWQQLAVAENLPDEALPTVINVLCTPALFPHGVDSRSEEWRREARDAALPTLLQRVSDRSLRDRLLQQTDDRKIAVLAEQGLVASADLPAILAARLLTPELVIGLARHPHQVDDAVNLLRHLSGHDLESIVQRWNPTRYGPDAASPPPLPARLVDGFLKYALTPFALLLADPGREDWDTCQRLDFGMPHQFDEGPGWTVLAACPDRWLILTADPVLGPAVQHVLLDHAAVEQPHDGAPNDADSDAEALIAGAAAGPALTGDVLQACLPALCLPEMAGLRKPSVSAAHRLNRIADRIRKRPRLLELAADQVHAAADECVRRGRLLAAPRASKTAKRHTVSDLAENLALLSINPSHLAKACALLLRLPQPAVVSDPPGTGRYLFTAGAERPTPAQLLERDYQHQRVAALTALAGNPHTPRAAVTDALPALHPVELSWICQQNGIPDWLHSAAAALAPVDDETAVLRLLTDDELDQHPDPGRVLQSWLDAPRTDSLWSSGNVYQAVLRSRHRTLDHLRQLPAGEVVTGSDPSDALTHLLAQCGNQPECWTALSVALDRGPTDDEITFGQLLDSIQCAGTSAPAAAV